MDLGNYIKKKREEKNLNLEELSKMIDISTAQLSRIENKKQIPGFYNIVKLSSALEISLNSLATLINLPVYEKTLSINGDEITLSSDKPVDFIQDSNKAHSINSILEDIEVLKDKVAKLEPYTINKFQTKKIPLINARKFDLFYSNEINIKGLCDIDFAFIAEQQNMEQYKIFNGDIVFVKKQDTCNFGQIAVIEVKLEEGINFLVLKICKDCKNCKIFLNGMGDFFEYKNNTKVIGVVTSVLRDIDNNLKIDAKNNNKEVM